MSKIAVVYWSGTGNTEAMANAVLKDGRVVEQGSPSKLKADKNSIFRRMTELQTQGAKWSI